jgi:ubiquinone/menaquinone biosynthesis C-methylase UbiE
MRIWGRRNASAYRIWAHVLGFAGYRRMVRRIGHDLPMEGRTLDIGCGDGEALRILSVRGFRNAPLIACDLSPEFIRIARRFRSGAGFLACDAESLAIGGGSCAAAISLGVLAHLLDPRLAILEMARVVRPGGMIAVWTRTDGSLSRLIALAFRLLNHGNAFSLHSEESVREALLAAGVAVFREERVAGGRLWIGRRTA